MGSCKRTIVVLGPDGAGKATTTGCMLFKVDLDNSRTSHTILTAI